MVATFGPEVLTPDGALDRPRLGDIVFADPELRGKLNAIVHPRVGAGWPSWNGPPRPGAIVVHDVPLIAENGRAGAYDVVVVVDAPPEDPGRAAGPPCRGMTREQARARMAAQASREQRLAIADIVIDNSGSLAELDRQVGDLWAELRRRAAESGP